MQELLPPNSIIVIYFFYGLAFFVLGLAVVLEARRLASNLPFARALIPLAIFGLVHGGHEWLEMFIKEAHLHDSFQIVPLWVETVRVIMLAVSFLALIAFGIKLLYPAKRPLKTELAIGIGAFLLWGASVLLIALAVHPGPAMRLTIRSWLLMADTWSRYTLAIPGALISSYALWRQAGTLPSRQSRFVNYLYLASATFFIYGVIGQIFATETYLAPSQLINAALFQQMVGFPIQLLRATMATILALTLIPTLDMFEVERQKTLEEAQQSARDELARRIALRQEMLRHTVATQEEERRRIARELHDEIGQTLTGLSLGLQSLLQLADTNPTNLSNSIRDLHSLTVDAVSDLSHLVTDLRPSQLDHLGLTAALRSLAQDYDKRFGIKLNLAFEGQRRRLTPDVELAVFRIAQESLTNVVRHAGVDSAQVQLDFGAENVELCIADQGAGFMYPKIQDDGRQHWGLLGMTERVTQLGGTLTIDTTPGHGTRVTARFPLNGKEGI